MPSTPALLGACPPSPVTWVVQCVALWTEPSTGPGARGGGASGRCCRGLSSGAHISCLASRQVRRGFTPAATQPLPESACRLQSHCLVCAPHCVCLGAQPAPATGEAGHRWGDLILPPKAPLGPSPLPRTLLEPGAIMRPVGRPCLGFRTGWPGRRAVWPCVCCLPS